MVTTNFCVTAPLSAWLGSLRSPAQDKHNKTRFDHFGARTAEKSTFAATFRLLTLFGCLLTASTALLTFASTFASASCSADPSPMQIQATLPPPPASMQQPAQPAVPQCPAQLAQTQQLESVDISMPQAASPIAAAAPVHHDFPDSPAASAMLLWAEEYDLSTVDAREAVLHVHKHHAKQVKQHDISSHVSLAGPLQKLMTRAVRVVTGNATFNRPRKPASAPRSKQQTASAAPRRSSRQHKPASRFWHVPPGPQGGSQ